MYTTENCDFKARGIAWLCTDPPSERGSIERLMKHTTCQVNKSNANYGCKEAADKYCTSSIPYCTVFIWPTRVQILEYEFRSYSRTVFPMFFRPQRPALSRYWRSFSYK